MRCASACSRLYPSIDAQARLLGLAVRWSLAGGIASLAVWAAILAGKMG